MEPQINTDEHRLNAMTERVIGCAYSVSNELGCGFLEKVYENALAYEIRQAGLEVEQQKSIAVKYKGLVVVGDYNADLVVENLIVVELKVVRAFDEKHSAQCLNYLKATGLPVCLMLNFGETRVKVKRFVSESYPCSSVFICGGKSDA